jgi:hypothetical protein
MFDTLFRGLAGRRPKAHVPRRVRPQVERLEDRAVPTAIRNLPGYMTNTLPANDDGSTGPVNVGFTLNFFSVSTNTVFVNNNGNITFNVPLAQFTPTALNTDNGGIPIIAPYFADVDTRGAGSGLVMYGNDTVCGLPSFGVDWFNVGYFASHVDKLSTFQLVLISRPDTGAGNFDIEFNYGTITWETGDASGGTNGFGGQSSRVGYSNGTGIPGTFFELPGSGVNGAFLDNGPDSLVGHDLMSTTLGRYNFMVRNGQVVMNTTTAPLENLDITNRTSHLNPFRFVFQHNLWNGRFLFTRRGGSITQTQGNACLDEGTTTTIAQFGPPIVLVFNQLPRGVTLANPTGFTASHVPFLVLSNKSFPQPGSRFRVILHFRNPRRASLGTFFNPFPIRVFAGAFDPTLL